MSAGNRRLREFVHLPLFAVVVATFLASASAATRWDVVPYAAANPILVEGSLVLHDDGGDVRVFSATAQRFIKIAPSGSPVLGSGDQVAVVRDGTQYRAYSARLNATADLTQGQPLVHSAFGDDVALLVFSGGQGTAGYAYSAVTNQWKPLAGAIAGSPAANTVVSRFVVAARTVVGVHGFSARKGEWVLLPGSQGAAAPQADGNVAITTGPLNPFGLTLVAAFSGVLGTWALSSPIVPGSKVELDHNVALCRAASGSSEWIAQGYSAYNGRFVSSTVKHDLALGQATYLSDNVVAITSALDATPGVEAFGARPGLAFAFLPSTVGGLYVPIGEDYLISKPVSGVNTVQVFSGVCSGTFIPYSFTSTFSGGFGGVHQFIAVDLAGTLIGYSAAKHAFAMLPLPVAYDVAVEDAVAELRQYQSAGARFHSIATRHGHFTSSPNQEAGASFATASAGSLVARRQLDGANADGILVFDERCDRYPALHHPGGPTQMTPGTNVLLVMLEGAPHTVAAYSVARGDWNTSPSIATGVPVVAPQAEDNVGCFVDSDGRLWAFGGDGDLHPFYSWPNDTEYQTVGVASGQIVIPPSPLAIAFAGEPGDLASLLLSLGFLCPGLAVFGYQNPLCLDPSTLSLIGPLGFIGSSRVLALVASGNTLSTPVCVQIWLQALLTNGPSGNWIGRRCEGMWFF